MTNDPKKALDRLQRDLVRVEDVAERLGCKVDELLADLEHLGVPVLVGRVSATALERAMTAAPGQAPQPELSDVELLEEILEPYRLSIPASRKGRGLMVTLEAEVSLKIGDPALDVGEAAYAPVRLKAGATISARVYVTKEMGSAARFSPSGYLREDGPALYLFMAREERRLWLCRSEELADFDAAVEAGEATNDDTGALGWWRPTPPVDGGSLRLWFRTGPTSLDISNRVRDSRDRKLVPGGAM